MTSQERFERKVIDREISLIDVLERAGVIPKGSYVVGRSCYCCFHDNENTPAAKLYSDESGITLFCFAEQKSYRSSDAFLRFTKFPISLIFNKVWSKLSKEEQDFYTNSIDGYEAVDTAWINNLKQLQPFKAGKMSYFDVLDKLLEFSLH